MDKKSFIFETMFLLLIIINNIYSIEEEEEKQIYYINFDLSDPDFKYENESQKIENIITNENSIRIPNIKLKKEGFYFNGWTSDFIYGYEPGDIFSPDKTNTTFFPIFEDKNDTTSFRVEYRVEYNGEVTDVSKELRPSTQRAKHLVQISALSYYNDKASSKGWTDGINEFYSSDKLVMPRKNLTLYAIFHNYHKLYYLHGNVDGIVGNPDAPLVYTEGASIDLAESTRLGRMGYKIVGWHCEYDGKDYPIFYPYILPDADIVMTAIWEPIEYTIVFITGVTNIPNIKIKAKTKETILVPNIDEKREGYIFIGWTFFGKQYKPGDELIVEGQMPGLGISGKAIWIKE